MGNWNHDYSPGRKTSTLVGDGISVPRTGALHPLPHHLSLSFGARIQASI